MHHHIASMVSVVFVLVLSAVFVSPYWGPFSGQVAVLEGGLQTGLISDATVVTHHTEEHFPVPVPTLWDGYIIGYLEGGTAYVMRRPTEDLVYLYFMEPSMAILEGHVRVHGLWSGYTCAYQKTVFGGECVPEVLIRSVELLE